MEPQENIKPKTNVMGLKKARREILKMQNLILGIILIGFGATAMWFGAHIATDGLKTVFSSEKVTAPKDLFHIAVTSMVRLKFPGPLLYFYNSQLGKTASPISVALFIEATNKRQSITRIFSYRIRALLTYDEGGEIAVTTDDRGNQKVTYKQSGVTVTKWRELHSIGFLHDNIYYVNNNNWKKAQHLGFSHNGFDNIAAEKQLRYGESIKGWVMLELEPDLRGQLPEIEELEFTLTNSAGESQVLKVPVAEEGKSYPLISSGSWKFLGGFHDLTKMEFTICPRIDVREIGRKESK